MTKGYDQMLPRKKSQTFLREGRVKFGLRSRYWALPRMTRRFLSGEGYSFFCTGDSTEWIPHVKRNPLFVELSRKHPISSSLDDFDDPDFSVMIRGRFLLSYGRLAFRAVISAGVVDHAVSFSDDCQPSVSGQQKLSEGNTKSPSSVPHKVYASCCGFPKDMVNGPSTVREQGVFGDDACFVAKYKNTHIAGVADGVGGWRRYGVDPSEFSSRLMRICFELVKTGDFKPQRPDQLLACAFETLSKPPRPVGSSTACVLVVHQDTLYSANLGDSGFLVIRNGNVVFRSREQQHYFNAPFQLSLPPADTKYAGFIGDSPEKADLSSFEIESGDIIVLATDGLWDNVPEHIIVDQLSHVSVTDVQSACNALALTARRLAFDTRHLSPFAVKASQHGIDTSGGKPDDITLVLLMIA